MSAGQLVSSGGVPIMTEKRLKEKQLEELKKLNNEEFMAFLMMYSPHGALCQVFIIEAIRFYSKLIAEQPMPQDNPDAIVSPIVWRGLAEDILGKHTMKYGRNDG